MSDIQYNPFQSEDTDLQSQKQYEDHDVISRVTGWLAKSTIQF